MTQMTYIVWQWSFRDFCHAIDMKLACWKHTEIDLRHPTVTLDITWHVAISSLWYAVILCLTVQLRESSLYSGYWEPNQGVSTSVCSPNVWEPQHIKHVAKFLRTNFSVLQDFPGKAWSREVKRKHWKSNLWLSLFLFFAPDQFAMNHNESNWKIFKDTFRETPPNRRLDRSKHWRRRAQVDHLLQWNQRIHVRKAPESWQRQLDPMVDEPWVEPHPSIDPQECWGNRKKALELPAKHFHNQCSIYIYISISADPGWCNGQGLQVSVCATTTATTASTTASTTTTTTTTTTTVIPEQLQQPLFVYGKMTRLDFSVSCIKTQRKTWEGARSRCKLEGSKMPKVKHTDRKRTLFLRAGNVR